jgi:FKBP-type peptidyl-prolyl cis-trans isomerase FklB
MKQWIIGILCVTLFGGVCAAEDTSALKDENDRINYSVGYQIGGDFKRQEVELNPEILVRGIQDALAGTQSLMTEEEMRRTLVDLKKKIVAMEQKQRTARVEKFREEGKKFLADNAKKEGIVTMPSGLQYQVLQQGSGSKPTLEDTVTVNYRGFKISGTEFDSSYKNGEPVTFPLKSVIPGWQEALPMMMEGAKWKIFLPPNLAFGDKGPMEDQTVIYEIELLSIKKDESKSEQKEQ